MNKSRMGLNIALYLSRSEISKHLLKERLAVIIDVLRASTSIIMALANGCKGITPVAEVEQAKNLAQKYHEGSILLGGERNELPIPGFDLSNSPLDYTGQKVRNKRIIFTSSNGAQLFQYTPYAKETIVAGFVNATAVSEYIINRDYDVAILCAGKHNRMSLEDVICGGMIIARLSQKKENFWQLNEGAVAANILYQHYALKINEMLYERPHGKRLIEIGQEKDLLTCGAVDSIQIIPMLKGSELVLFSEEQSYTN